MDFVQDATNKLIEESNRKMNDVLSYKLRILEIEAIQSGENELARILAGLDLKQIEKTRFELEKNGYTIELEQPQATFDFKDNVTSATVDLNNLKIKVRKLILEV